MSREFSAYLATIVMLMLSGPAYTKAIADNIDQTKANLAKAQM